MQLMGPIDAWGFIFCDDSMYLIAQEVFDLISSMIILFRLALGDPIAMHKLQAGAEIIWIGFKLNLSSGTVAPKPDKYKKTQELVRMLLAPTRKIVWRDIAHGRGLLNWVASVHECLRPFLASFFFVERDLGSRCGQISWDACPEAIMMDLIVWNNALQKNVFNRFLEKASLDLTRLFITDACAGEGADINCLWHSGCGIGGVGPRGEWFAEEIREEIFPWLAIRRQGSSLSGALEMLGTVVALKLWGPSSNATSSPVLVAIPTLTDNQGNSYIYEKWYTSIPPAAWILREIALEAISRECTLAPVFIKGKMNVRSDRLSRGFISNHSIRSLGLDATSRRRPQLDAVDFWKIPELVRGQWSGSKRRGRAVGHEVAPNVESTWQ